MQFATYADKLSKVKMHHKYTVILLWLIITLSGDSYSEDVNINKDGRLKNDMESRSKRSNGLLSELFDLIVQQKIERLKLIKEVEKMKKQLQNQHGTYSTVKEMENLKQELKQLKKELNFQKNKQAKTKQEIQNMKKTIKDNHFKVSFTARVSKHLKLPKDSIILYDHVITNEGNGFNATEGAFYCPVDGVYMISASLEVFNARVISVILKNSHGIGAITKGSPSDIWNSNSVTVMARLHKGDRVWVKNLHKANIWGVSYFSGVWISK